MMKYSIKVRNTNTLCTAYHNGKYHSEKIVSLPETKEITEKLLLKKHSQKVTDFTMKVAKLFKAKEIII